jgi:hypothetical protein
VTLPADFEARLLARVRADVTLLDLLNVGLSGFGRTLLDLINMLIGLLPSGPATQSNAV